MKDWSAHQYLKFEDERSRPSRDLVRAIPLADIKRAVDIGCGPGNSTEIIAAHWPNAVVTGFDSSPDMVRRAKERLPDLAFEVADIYQWRPPADTDLLFSNAVFQWLPDHIVQMRRLFDALQTGAVLALQMPDNLSEPIHAAMQDVAQDPRWCARIGNIARKKLPDAAHYYDAFAAKARYIDIWHTIYNHALADHDAIVEWVKGAAMQPFLAPLSADETQDYLALYREKIAMFYPLLRDGKVLLRFPRLFMVVVK